VILSNLRFQKFSTTMGYIFIKYMGKIKVACHWFSSTVSNAISGYAVEPDPLIGRVNKEPA